MKRLLITTLCLICSFVNAQTDVQEPDFIGESFIVNEDQTVFNLDKQNVQIKTKAGAGLYLAGIGKVKTKIEIDGCCSEAVYSGAKPLKLVVRAVDNDTDPLSIIQVFKFQKKKKKRLAELASAGSFSGTSSNNLEYLKFSAKRYGKNSYILTINNFDNDAEYGVIVKNPNSVDQKNIVVSSFGVR